LERGTFSEKIESVASEGRLKVEIRVREREDSHRDRKMTLTKGSIQIPEIIATADASSSCRFQ